MKQLSVLIDDVAREAPGCRRPFMINALIKSAKEFCTRTNVWKRDVPTIPGGTHCTAIYLTAEGSCLCGPTDQSAAHLSDSMVWKDQSKICDDTGLRDPVPANARVVRLIAPYAPDCFAYEHDANVLVIRASVPVSGLKVVLMPINDDVPDFLIDLHDDAMIYGALYRLHSMRGQSWSDRDTREHNRVEFERTITDAKVSAADNNVAGPRFNQVRGLPGAP